MTLAKASTMLAIFALPYLTSPAIAKDEKPESVEKTVDEETVTIWKIEQPRVTQRETKYQNIVFKPGDVVKIKAGGCVQTGGTGKTWKKYVDPQGPNSDHIYHGMIRLPGMPGLTRIQDFLANTKKWTVPDNLQENCLYLGYEDDDYGDNGYWGHDDGTGDQCKAEGNASVEIIIVHKT